MKLRSCVLPLAFCLPFTVLMESCAPVFMAESEVSTIEVTKKDNGYLVELACNGNIRDVTAFISPDNWLVITLVGATVDFDRLRTTKPNELVSSVQVVGYGTSVQLTLKLKQNYRSCEVIRNQSSNDISIALFTE